MGSAPAPIQTRVQDIIPTPDPTGPATMRMLEASRQGGENLMAMHRMNLDLATKMPPIPLTYDAPALSQQAFEFGLQNVQRSQAGEELLDPAAAAMRREQSEKVRRATSDEEFLGFMDRFFRERGLPAVAGTGVDPSSTFGQAAMFDTTTEAGRKKMLEDIATRQSYLQATPAPLGGLDPGAAVAGQEAAKAANIGQMNQFQQQTLQNLFGQTQSYGDFVNRMMGETASGFTAEQENIRNYQQQLINDILGRNAQQNAALGAQLQGQQAMTGTIAGAGIGAAGMLGAAAIMI